MKNLRRQPRNATPSATRGRAQHRAPIARPARNQRPSRTAASGAALPAAGHHRAILRDAAASEAATLGRSMCNNLRGLLCDAAPSSSHHARPARMIAARASPAVNKKRTKSGKAAQKEEALALTAIAQEVVPLQIIAPFSAVPAETESVMENVAQEQRVEITVEVVHEIIAQIISETADMEQMRGNHICDMLSALHRVVLEELRTQMQVHGLTWERTCYSSLFEGDKRDRGAVIARSNTSTRSLCWLRTKIMVNGSWVIQEANDLWKRLPKKTVPLTIELSRQRQFDDTLAPPVGTFNWCKILAVVSNEEVRDVTVDQTEFCGTFRRGLDVQIVLSYSSSSSSCSRELMDFHVNSPSNEETSVTQFDSLVDPPVGTNTPVDQISLPTAPTTYAVESFTALRASISRIFVNHEKASRRLGDSQSEILFKIDHLEKTFVDALTQQDLAFRSLFKSVRQEAQNQAEITSIELKVVRAQNVALMTDLADTRKEFQELKADFSNDILDFRAQAQENYNTLTTQLYELVDYINRGGNDKKGESSSRGP
ncbi:hypothetical protein F511_17478 [Dorcoceras hygrometricum]|uniref:Uncharacterized protein n=1 Tax=Dorcoceras hygrometricum TaxID=472368 RepID=A0A2Z7C7K7_9LAMI|nr:hypothetical protein F511_17478 [Dorcoceras hygrometricum]